MVTIASAGSLQTVGAVGPASVDQPKPTEDPKKLSRPVEPAEKSVKKSENPLDKAAEVIEGFLSELGSKNTRLQIDLDEDAGVFIYKSVNPETGEVISQFPSDDVVRALTQFRDAEGLVVDKRA